MDLRNRMYDRGLLPSYPLGARTISVGNLTTGGTGKTPLVAAVAGMLAQSGEKVCILTRGYGRTDAKERVLVSDGESVIVDAATGGDEPVELARKLLGKAVVLADADRVAAARWAREKFGITAFVLDDGFQHRRAQRDLDIVCIDATNPCGNGRILPAGTLRESFKGLRRAGAIVITRANLVDSTEDLVTKLRKLNADAPIFKATMRISEFVTLEDFLAGRCDAAQTVTEPYVFCGLGNPENFRRQLESEGVAVSGFRSFGDHRRYMQPDADSLVRAAKTAGASSILTTAKDAVKLAGLNFEMPIFVAETEMVVKDEEEFRNLIINSPP